MVNFPCMEPRVEAMDDTGKNEVGPPDCPEGQGAAHCPAQVKAGPVVDARPQPGPLWAIADLHAHGAVHGCHGGSSWQLVKMCV